MRFNGLTIVDFGLSHIVISRLAGTVSDCFCEKSVVAATLQVLVDKL
jgi:hypothetical protein